MLIGPLQVLYQRYNTRGHDITLEVNHITPLPTITIYSIKGALNSQVDMLSINYNMGGRDVGIIRHLSRERLTP